MRRSAILPRLEHGPSLQLGPPQGCRNARKHGITFEEAATAFADPRSLTIPDPAHSEREERFLLLGMSSRPRLLVVVHIERHENEIRIVSARPATRAEHHTYQDD